MPSAESRGEATAAGAGARRILVVAPEAPWPPVNGIRTKLSGFIDSIGMPVDLISPEGTNDGVEPPGVTWTRIAPQTGTLPRLSALARGRLPVSSRLPIDEVVEVVGRRMSNGVDYDIVHLDTLATAHLASPIRDIARRHGGRPTVVLSLNDSYSLLLSSGVLENRVKTALYTRYARLVERRLLPAADHVDVVSNYDLEWLNKMVPRSHTRLVPLGLNVDAFDGGRLEPRWDVLYVGAMAEWAFHWLRSALDAVLPGLRRKYPALRVAAAGPDATPEARQYLDENAVDHLGFVGDLSELFRSSKTLLVPSRQRAGSPTKALQAMAAGTPVVGMEAVASIPNGRDCQTHSSASDWKELIARIDVLLSDPLFASQVGDGGRELVRAQHSWPVVRNEYLRCLGSPTGQTS